VVAAAVSLGAGVPAFLAAMTLILMRIYLSLVPSLKNPL